MTQSMQSKKKNAYHTILHDRLISIHNFENAPQQKFTIAAIKQPLLNITSSECGRSKMKFFQTLTLLNISRKVVCRAKKNLQN